MPVVAGDGDAYRAVGVVGDQGRVLQPDAAFERGYDPAVPAVQDLGPVGGGHDDVLVAPPRSAVATPPCTAPTGRLQMTEPSVASRAYTDPPPGPPSVPSSTPGCRAPGRRPGPGSTRSSRRGAPARRAGNGCRRPAPCPCPSPGRWCPCRRRCPVAPPARKPPTAGDDSTPTSGLASQSRPPVGLPVPALPVGARIPHMAALGVLDAVGQPGRLVTALDDVRAAVAVQVGQRRGGEAAVSAEPGEAGEDRPRGGGQGVLLLADRRGDHVQACPAGRPRPGRRVTADVAPAERSLAGFLTATYQRLVPLGLKAS